ncbi:alpha/beta hydrolase [Bdellovibrio sp. qaytius]|nr:alpha/beta hydrolase [Bdellovibrio sp. qaytius]
MHYIEVGRENSATIDLHYQDHGSGKPVILLHGWPLNERSWENQEAVLLAKGFRVISYARRGFGDSSKPATGYNYDTFAEDLHKLITKLDLREITLVGFSMGTGEIARYISTYGSDRIEKAVFISGILPALLKTEGNQAGVEKKVFDEMIKKCIEDRPAFIAAFLKDFYSHGILGLKEVSQEVINFSWNLAMEASAIATVNCIDAWLEDFRSDIAKITIPSLVIHGSGDRITPIKATGERLKEMLPGCQYIEIDGGPHGLLASHANEVNAALVKFLGTAKPLYTEAELRH